MKLPQLTIKSILFATFWMAVAFGSYAIIDRAHHERRSMPLEAPLTYVMMIAPFVAVGALLRKTLLGMVVGVIAVVGFWIVFSLT